MGIRHPLFGKVQLDAKGIAPDAHKEERFRYQDFDLRELDQVPQEINEEGNA